MTPILISIVYIFLALALLFTVLRLMIGPTLSDRVVALDLLGFVVLSIVAVSVLIYGRTIYLDVLTVAALILFFGTVAFSRYIERRAR